MLHVDRAEKKALALVLVLVLFLSGCQSQEAEVLKASLLKVGKADAIVVRLGAQTMVIDAGEEEDGEEVVEFLREQGISTVNTLIITHFDKDHVGGADTLVEALEIEEVLLPDYEADGMEYLDFMAALEKQGITPQRLRQSMEFALGGASVLVEPPQDYGAGYDTADIDNDLSLITTVTYGEKTLLFTGDAEKKRLREWLSGETVKDCDFLKVPHHGVYNAALKELLAAVTPEYAAVCTSKKNPAQQKTLDALKEYRVQTFQTRDGCITVSCDGARLEVTQERK